MSFLFALALLDIAIIAYQSQRKNPIIHPVKFFQIGFSKCGTTTLADFFYKNGIPVAHHNNGDLAQSIYDNYQAGRPLLSPLYLQFYGFFDMEKLYENPPINIPTLLFKELDKQYPGSKFILNTRNKQDWLQSYSMHPAYQHGMRWLDLHAKFYNISTADVLAKWSQEWDDHHKAVLEYFKDRPQDLVVFDIDNDVPYKLCAFFKNYFNLNPSLYGHLNSTAAREKKHASPTDKYGSILTNRNP